MQESSLAAQEKMMADMRDELAYLKEQDGTTIKVSSQVSARGYLS
jgi:hypothetical protein